MRSDMCKVIVERPRRGGGRDQKRRQAREFDELPSKQSMKRGHTDLKDLNENLAPLKRYLRKHTGRPWDKVFGEICENIRMDNAVQKHVRGHVFDYVDRHVIVEGGKIYARRPWGAYELWNGDLYVCPKSGLLKEYRRRSQAPARRRSPLDESLKGMTSGKSKTVVEGNKVFKDYLNPDTGEFDLRNPARPVHAEIDFHETLRHRGLKAMDLFFAGFSKYIPMNHPYWAAYSRLYQEHKEKLSNPQT